METVWELAFQDSLTGAWVTFGYFGTSAEACRRAEEFHLYHFSVREVLA